MTMKLNKSKGKVHPSPSSSSSSSSSSSTFSLSSSSSDPVSSLNLLLPAAILTLISVLSLQDREVLAYMITRSLKSAANPASILDDNTNRQRKPKKSPPPHKSPSFDCGCFDCYTSYWFRWDSSPNRELIHQAIEAFEEHLASTEQAKKSGKPRRREKEKEKDKSSRHGSQSPVVAAPEMGVEERVVVEADSPGTEPNVGSLEKGESTPETVAGEETTTAVERVEEEEEQVSGGHKEEQPQQVQQQHKGLVRKVLPDVIGLFNWRLWNLLGPDV